MPKNKLSAEEVQQVLAICHEPWLANLPPAQIVPALADEVKGAAGESGRAKDHSVAQPSAGEQ